MVICDYYYAEDNFGSHYVQQKPTGSLKSEDIIKDILLENNLTGVLWNKLIKR